ncbi:MAG: ATP-binding cassette domain-containing protein, partial [Clostridia bacterium]|nr:ATP-binding cassette domain-containing protein [Clostridia bacterium]
MEQKNAIEMVGITKAFGAKVIANKNVSMELREGEILALLGENGSGKTTLMNMIAGIYTPDQGRIYVHGEEVVIKSPIDAFNYHIGMIHQHFKLVDLFTAADNIILGEKPDFDYKGKKAAILAQLHNKDNPAQSGDDNVAEEAQPEEQEAPAQPAEKAPGKGKLVGQLIALPFLRYFNYLSFNLLRRSRVKKLQAIVDQY